ncbi:MAG: Trk system potassium transporter TrkA [Thermoleophilia bacterium]|nr:Trk system potassium transporter TrkA [Thermoleophilia bacterium]MDH4339220.1 Trk system potassium transporter TrkA [Thermoleophilia bacterium]MDH5280977.1 Trk system potassium transporter TrkA [Thermoleophilia bacterium]
MKVFIIGAGQVGSTVVDALHGEHELTVLDTELSRLSAIAYRYDVATFEGDGTSRRDLAQAGVGTADLVIACTSRNEVNLVAGMFARREAPKAKTIIRTSEIEYVDLWREGQLDVDFVVCPELETAHAISRIIGVPAARQTDVFAEGQVQIVEFDVEEGASAELAGVPLRHAQFPRDSKVMAIIRKNEMTLPGGDDVIEPGSRVVVIGSPRAAKEWSALLVPGDAAVQDVVIFGAGRVGSAIARVLLDQRIGVRMIEASRERALAAAETFSKVRVYNATGLEADFLERERIGLAQAAIFAMRDDARNLYAASLARVHGVPFTIAVAHDAVSLAAFDQAGIDVAVNPRAVTAEEIVRFAHDPRTQQVAMLEGNRYEVLDVTTRDSSRYIGAKFRDMPVHGAMIGAIVRNGSAIFPHGDDVLEIGDRVIVFTEASNAPWVIEAL